VTSLVDEETIDVKFPAPSKPGSYQYTMCLKSDSYIDMDLYQTLKVSSNMTQRITKTEHIITAPSVSYKRWFSG